MKLPKTFKPDKNLDDKTNQLVEEANSIPDEEDIEEELLKIITFKEFKELIELRDEHRSNPPGIKTSKNLHEEVDKMMKKAGYNSLRTIKYKFSEKAYEYYIARNKGKSTKKVLIRSYLDSYWPKVTSQYELAQYKFAILTDEQLKDIDKFAQTFERYDRRGLVKLLTLSTKNKVEKYCQQIIYDDREALVNAFK